MIDEATEARERAHVIAHYGCVAPLVAKHFAGTPLIALFRPNGDDESVVRVGQLHHPVPPHIPQISVATRSGTRAYIALTQQSLLWRVHTRALSFESWTPTAADPLAVRFARLVLSARGNATLTVRRTAARTARAVLQARGIDAFPLLDGRSIALYIPFDEAPNYDAVRAWLHTIMAEAARREPTSSKSRTSSRPIASTSPRSPMLPASARPCRIRCAPKRGSRWSRPPRGPNSTPSPRPGGRSITPPTASPQATSSQPNWPASARNTSPPPPQRRRSSPGSSRTSTRSTSSNSQPRSDVITVALRIRADGKPRTVDEILAEAVARDILPRDERKKYVYATLKAYVEKMIARGLHPLIVQNPDRRFRSNHPADDLPDPQPDTPYAPPRDVIARLTAAAAFTDPTAFEKAVSAAFEPLGFDERHVAGAPVPIPDRLPLPLSNE